MKLNNKVLRRVVAIGLVLGLTTAWADDHAIASSGLVGTCYEGVLTVLAPDRIRLKTMTVQDRLK